MVGGITPWRIVNALAMAWKVPLAAMGCPIMDFMELIGIE
jgi:L-alanine-DL-glutamate epimerase-like enolase superfamily enzyme